MTLLLRYDERMAFTYLTMLVICYSVGRRNLWFGCQGFLKVFRATTADQSQTLKNSVW